MRFLKSLVPINFQMKERDIGTLRVLSLSGSTQRALKRDPDELTARADASLLK